MVNNLGSTPTLEIYIMARAALKYATQKHKVETISIGIAALGHKSLLARRNLMLLLLHVYATGCMCMQQQALCYEEVSSLKDYIGHHDMGAQIWRHIA